MSVCPEADIPARQILRQMLSYRYVLRQMLSHILRHMLSYHMLSYRQILRHMLSYRYVLRHMLSHILRQWRQIEEEVRGVEAEEQRRR